MLVLKKIVFLLLPLVSHLATAYPVADQHRRVAGRDLAGGEAGVQGRHLERRAGKGGEQTSLSGNGPARGHSRQSSDMSRSSGETIHVMLDQDPEDWERRGARPSTPQHNQPSVALSSKAAAGGGSSWFKPKLPSLSFKKSQPSIKDTISSPLPLGSVTKKGPTPKSSSQDLRAAASMQKQPLQQSFNVPKRTTTSEKLGNNP